MEIFKVYRNISPTIFIKFFLQHDMNYNLQRNPEFAVETQVLFSMEVKVFHTLVIRSRDSPFLVERINKC